MTFSTRQNPRLAQSGVALTSLGAVGGARGTAAGALRIFVEFLTTYDKGAIKELSADIDTLDKKSRFAAAEDTHRQRKLAGVRQKIREADVIYSNKIDAQTRKQIKLVEGLTGVRTKAGKAELAQAKVQLDTLLRAQGLNSREVDLIKSRSKLRQEEARIVAYVGNAEERALARSKQRQQTEAALGKIQAGRAAIAPRLAGLAIGAIGGIVGGAVLGVGFALAEEALAKIGDKIQDLIDPARHAKVEVKELAKAVNDIAAGQGITQLEAARQFLGTIGVNPSTERGTQLAGLLQEVAVRQQIIDALQQQTQLMGVLANKQALDEELRKKTADALIAEAKALGTYTEALKTTTEGDVGLLTGTRTFTQQYINGVELQSAVTQRLTQLTDELGDAQARLAADTARAAANASNAAALWNVYADSLANAINAATGLATAGIDDKIQAVREQGDSKRTQQIQAQIDNARSGGGGDGGARARELANIAEERAIILLRQRLRLMGTNINLEKYSGKFLLEAINAKIAALQKEGEAQQRVNQLLNIQMQLSKTAERQQGESINDFLERRASEQRNLLVERDDLIRQAQISELEARKESVEDQIALEELAERKRDALRKEGTSNHLSNLQKQLAASKAADEKARQAKIKALEKQKQLLEKAAAEAIKLTSETAQKETLAAINGMQNLDDVARFSGRLAGLKRAKAAIEALVEGFGLPKAIAQPFLDKLNGMIGSAEDRASRLYRNVISKPGQAPTPFAKGGIFELNNANNPFGSNTRTGEEGTEIGIILSRNVAEILKKQKPGVGQIGPIYIEKSRDPMRDAYALRKAVESGVEAALS